MTLARMPVVDGITEGAMRGGSRALSTASRAASSMSRMSSAQGSWSNSIRLWKFARDVGVAEGVIDRVEPAIGQEVVVHDDAPLQILGDRAALFVGAIEGEGEARRCVQPLQLACDAKPGFVEMANLRLRHALADERVNLPQRLCLLSDPGDHAGRTDQRGVVARIKGGQGMRNPNAFQTCLRAMQSRHRTMPLLVRDFAPDVRRGPRTQLCARTWAHRRWCTT